MHIATYRIYIAMVRRVEIFLYLLFIYYLLFPYFLYLFYNEFLDNKLTNLRVGSLQKHHNKGYLSVNISNLV